jgi:putative tryptophan/tyrosine transport system substrate-binding protein
LFAFAQTDELGQTYVAIFRQRLQELGWISGRNVQIDERWGADDSNRIQSYARELVSLKPDVIFCHSGLVLPHLQRETHTIPIVFVQVADPLAIGYVASLAHPGGNITGFALSEFSTGEKMLEVLKEVAPNIDRLAVILNLEQPAQVGVLRAIEGAAATLRVQISIIGAHDASQIERSIEDLAKRPNAGLIVLPNPITNRHRDLIIALAARHRLPAAYRYRYFVTDGGLISYGERPDDSFRGAASYVNRILRGEKVGDLPVQQPTKFELIVNLKTAKALGLDVPGTLLARADEVIE